MRNCLTALLALLVLGGNSAQADGGPPTIEWHNWKLHSNEPLNIDLRNQSNVINNRVAFPMTNLLDGDPDTAWVWHDLDRKYREYPREFTLTAQQTFAVDELWLMNGYNRRRDLFQRNDRVVEIRILRDNKVIKTVNLKDAMGWRKISLPRRIGKEISIQLTGIRKGDGTDNDICLSEMALFDRRRQIDLRMPQAVVYRLSYCCGGTGYLMTRSGRVFAKGSFGEGQELDWNPTGRYVAGVGDCKGEPSIWVADARKARIVRRKPVSPRERGVAFKWQNKRTLEVTSGLWSRKPGTERRRIVRIPTA